ncbi:MAG: STAS domain-containing protein [Rudaea sp.]
MGLEIAQEQQDALRILALRGRLDTDTSADLELAVQDLLAAGARDFLIDLGEVSYVSSAGLRVLLALAKQLEGSKGRLRLCALGPAVLQVFEVAGFSKLFVILKDRAAATAGADKPAAPPQPSLAQQVTRILRVGMLAPAHTSQAAALARDTAQLLGVRHATNAAAASRAASAVPAAQPAGPPSGATNAGVLGKLRGVFGKKS